MRKHKSFKQICWLGMIFVGMAFIIMQFIPDAPHIPTLAPWWVWPVGMGLTYVVFVFSYWFAQYLTDWTFAGIAWLWSKVMK